MSLHDWPDAFSPHATRGASRGKRYNLLIKSRLLRQAAPLTVTVSKLQQSKAPPLASVRAELLRLVQWSQVSFYAPSVLSSWSFLPLRSSRALSLRPAPNGIDPGKRMCNLTTRVDSGVVQLTVGSRPRRGSRSEMIAWPFCLSQISTRWSPPRCKH